MITHWKHSSLKTHFLGWLQGWCGLIDGLITVISLGFLASNLEFKMCVYKAKSDINDLSKRR